MSNGLLSFLLVIFSIHVGTAQTSTPPNVVVILADDIGPGDLSGYRRLLGEKVIVETPNLDQLMKEGTSFADAHSPNALCAPSRYAIMTGNNTYHSYAPWGVWGSYKPSPIKETDMTLGKLMKSAGYQTAFLGKWHIGGDYYRKGTEEIYVSDRSKEETNVDLRQIVGGGPSDQGFDYSLTFPAGIQAVPFLVYENEKWLPLYPGSKITRISNEKVGEYGYKLNKPEGPGDSNWNAIEMGPLLANKAVNYIRKANENQPMFVYYCSQAVHLPHAPPLMLDGEEVRGTTPSFHLDMVKELDVQVGMIVKALKEKGAYENTVFIFTSDNGGLLIEPSIKAGHNSPAIYRGGKNQIFEGGHRVPFIAVWPGKIPADVVSPDLISGSDILASLAELTGQQLAPHQGMDSYSFLDNVKGLPNAPRRDYLLIQGGTDRKVIYRDGSYKLIMQSDNTGEKITPISLFDLEDNVEEKPAGDLIDDARYSKRVQEMFSNYIATRTGKLRTDGQSTGD